MSRDEVEKFLTDEGRAKIEQFMADSADGDNDVDMGEVIRQNLADHAAALHGPADTSAGYSDEPQGSGAVVAVHYGEPQQEIWVRSRSNIGNWYPLGSEYGRPRPWDDPRNELEKLSWRGPVPRPGPGEVPRHPQWGDVLDRGPVTLLVAGDGESYRNGWRNGRRRMVEQMEATEDDE